MALNRSPLEDLNPKDDSNITLEDVSPEVQPPAATSNKASNTNLAAYSAMFSENPDEVLTNYDAVSGQMEESGQSGVSDRLISNAQAVQAEKVKTVLPSMLADPTISDEDKRKAIENVFDETSSIYHPANILASEALIQPMPEESKESEDVRFDSSMVINRANAIKRAKQNLLNQELAKYNPTVTNKVLDILQLMVPGANQYMTAKARSEATGETLWSYIKSFISPGSSEQDIRDMIANAPPDKQVLIAQHLLDVVKNTGGIVMSNPNHFKQVQLMQQVVGQGEISDQSKFLDAVSSVADLAFGAGTIAKALEGAKAIKAAKASRAAAAADEAAGEAFVRGAPKNGPSGPSGASQGTSAGRELVVPNTIVSKVQPVSVSQVLKDTNPEQFRTLHTAMANDQSGKVADAAYGTTREDAIITDLGPQVATDTGSVTAKVNTPDANVLKDLDIDPDLEFFVKHDGAIYYTDKQKAANNARITNDFSQAFGVTSRKEMFQILGKLDAKFNGNTATIRAVYGPQQSGFNNPESAIEAVKFALRDYGVTDEHITLLKRDGGDYVPVDPKTVTGGVDPGFSVATSDADIKKAYDAGNFAETVVNGNKIRLVGVDHGGDVRQVTAFDTNGKQIGQVLYGQGGERIDNPNVKVDPEWQRKGVASAMYDYAEKHGAKFPTPDTQRFSRSEAGQAFRDARANSKRPRLEFGGNGNGDYLVRVDMDYKYNPSTMSDYPINSVKNNIFMRSGVLQGDLGAGSLQRHLVNITSMLEPHLTLGMSKAVTKSAGVMREFVRLATDATKDFSKLKAAEKATVMSMIREGNYVGKWWNETEMQAAGLSDLAKDSLRKFRKYWDNHFFFENLDHTKTLSNAGYMMFESAAHDTKLWARPINSVMGVPDNVKVYDPVLDQVRVMRDDELVDLYNKGGKIGKLEFPEFIGDQPFQHIVSQETAADGYLRAFNEFDQTLNYRPGYYHVAYKNPMYVVKRIKDSAGREIATRAVANAANTKDAEILAKRLSEADGDEYFVRPDQQSQFARDTDNRSVQRARGRSPQRLRGKRLENASANVNDPSQSHIQSPSEAMINSARSISRRVSMRDPLDAMKHGLLEQYGKLMPQENGRAVFPSNILDIKNPTGEVKYNKQVADARSTFEYIRQMEVGYVNHIDEGYKALLNKVGDILGDASTKTDGVVSSALQKAEGGVRTASTVRPTKVLRTGANTFFIVANPIRQLLVQGHQVAQLVPLNPQFFANPKNIALVDYIISKQLGVPNLEEILAKVGIDATEAEKIWNQYKTSGNYAAVDVHTMINDSLKDFVDGVTPAQKVATAAVQYASKPISLLRKVGFDAGENFNQLLSWLVFRDRAIKAGRSMDDKAVADEVAATATNFTGNMNKAGQNPYEANTLSIGLQFMGWAHRWAGIMTGNRIFSKGDKAKLWAYTLALYGIPGGLAGYGMFQSILPDDPDTRDTIIQGLAGAAYNKIASVISGEDIHADWSGSLSPFDMYGTASHLKEVMTGDIGALFTDSPAGTMFFGGNPKITNLVKDAAKWSNLSEDDKDHPTKLSTVAKDFLQLFGGLSNAYKAKYAFETGKKLSSYTGKITDKDITNTQALLLAAGIPDFDEAKTRYINGVMYDSYKELESDVQKFHDERKRLLLNDDITPDQFKYYLAMTNEFFRAFPNSTEANQIYRRLVRKDIESGDARAIKQIMSMHGMMNKEQALMLANLYPDTDAAKRKQYIDIINFLYSDEDKSKEK